MGGGVKAALAELELEVGKSRYASAEHFRKAYEMKYLGVPEASRLGGFRFCLRNFFEVVKLNWWAVLRRLGEKRKQN